MTARKRGGGQSPKNAAIPGPLTSRNFSPRFIRRFCGNPVGWSDGVCVEGSGLAGADSVATGDHPHPWDLAFLSSRGGTPDVRGPAAVEPLAMAPRHSWGAL